VTAVQIPGTAFSEWLRAKTDAFMIRFGILDDTFTLRGAGRSFPTVVGLPTA